MLDTAAEYLIDVDCLYRVDLFLLSCPHSTGRDRSAAQSIAAEYLPEVLIVSTDKFVRGHILVVLARTVAQS